MALPNFCKGRTQVNTRLNVAMGLLVLTGCGIPLTPNAHPCGIHPASQMEVWVDGVGSMDAGLAYLEAAPDGGQAEVPSPVRYMTCEKAFQNIDAAMAIGDTHDFWKDRQNHKFLNGMRIEFIGDENLAAVGEPRELGYTMNSPFSHTMAVAYGRDGDPDYSMKYERTEACACMLWGSAVTLAHEMVHVLQSDSFLNLGVLNTHTDKHCHWASVYAPRYSDLGWAQYSSNFTDGCENESCSGSACSHESTS